MAQIDDILGRLLRMGHERIDMGSVWSSALVNARQAPVRGAARFIEVGEHKAVDFLGGKYLEAFGIGACNGVAMQAPEES